MKDTMNTINYKDKEYKIIFNLNVMEQIQEEYGTLDKWGDLTDGVSGEVNVKALIFGLMSMINEGIEIENDEKGIDIPLFNKKQVGRMLTELGIQEMTEKVNETVIESTKSDEKNV